MGQRYDAPLNGVSRSVVQGRMVPEGVDFEISIPLNGSVPSPKTKMLDAGRPTCFAASRPVSRLPSAQIKYLAPESFNWYASSLVTYVGVAPVKIPKCGGLKVVEGPQKGDSRAGRSLLTTS